MREAENDLETRPTARSRPTVEILARHGRRRLVGTAAVSFVGAYLVLVAVMWTMARLVLSSPAMTGLDRSVVVGLVPHRTPLGDTISSIGTMSADTVTITLATTIVVGVLAVRRHWAAAGLVAAAVLLKVTVFLTTTVLVQRERPEVPRLDEAPPTSSFPSGHVAASIAFWFSVAIAVTWLTPRASHRALAWGAAALVPPCVAASRLYRGMHFPTDVVAGYLLGVLAAVAAVGVVLLVVSLAGGRTSTTAGALVTGATQQGPGRDGGGA